TCHRPYGAFLSFPTRRSSDLEVDPKSTRRIAFQPITNVRRFPVCGLDLQNFLVMLPGELRLVQLLIVNLREPEVDVSIVRMLLRSEEHTSELQSLRHLVCRLL